MWGACLFALVLMVVQLMQGTAPFFALCSFAFILVSTAAFNLAGGFSRPSGSYIFFFSTLTLIVGLCTKAVLGEAADSNLLVPHTTISVYLVGICAMYCSVFVSRKLVPRKGILQDLVTDKNLQNATVGCLVMGIFVQIIVTIVPKTSGSVISALVQINRFYPMAMILGVIHQVRKSGGTRSINLPVLVAGAALLYLGIIGFSKEGMFTPVACWLATIACQNYKLSRVQVVGLAAGLTFMFVYLVPYSQYGRDYEILEDSLESHVKASLYLLSNLDMVREEYKASRDFEVSEKRGYFNVDVGFLNRLEMVSVDDELIELTERTGSHGIYPLIQGFQNLVPHFLWNNKPTVTTGNAYAHEVGGIIGDNDDDTGISFSAMGEGYHLAKWMGILIAAPILWTMLFTLFDSLCGDVRLAPWGLLIVVYFSHMAPEGMLGGIIYAMGYVAFGLIVAALSAAYVMPILGSLIKGPERTVVVPHVRRVGSIPRRSSTLPSPGVGQ